METSISILGCGWLGLPLAEQLIQLGYSVKGSTTDKSKFNNIEAVGAIAYSVSLMPDWNIDFDISFLDCDVLIVNFPPHRRDDIIEYHRLQYEALCRKLSESKGKKIIMISSTSVYPDVSKVVTEKDAVNPDKDSGKALLISESLLQRLENMQVTIVRFGGLIGYDRNPARFLSGKKELKDGSVPVNLIHRDDCIAIIIEILKQQKWGRVYNACCDEHPTRKVFYTLASRLISLPEPQFSDQESNYGFKIIDSSVMKNDLQYSFKYKSPLDCLR